MKKTLHTAGKMGGACSSSCITVVVLMLMHGAFIPFVDAATVPKLKFSDDPISRNAPPPASFAPVIKKVASHKGLVDILENGSPELFRNGMRNHLENHFARLFE